MPLYRWEIIRRRKPLITRKLHDVSQVLYLPFDKNHEPYSVESYDPTQVLRLPFEDPPQEITYDRSGYGNHGTIYDATRVKGKVGNALNFKGVDSYVKIPDDPTLRITGAITLQAWIYMRTIDRWNRVIDKHYLQAYRMGVDEYNRFHFDLCDGVDVYTLNSLRTLEANTWYHLAAVYDGSTMLIYINGSLDNTRAGPTQIGTGPADLYIGTPSDAPGHELYSMIGIIDEARIHSRALSQSEIKRLMNLRGV